MKTFAMVMVVLCHITSHGIRNAQILPFGEVWWIVAVWNTFSTVAVDCFALITGYYLSASVPRVRKPILLWIQMFTYSLGLYLLLCLFPGAEISFSIKELIRHSLPMLSNQYWFVKYYILLLLLVPFLNHVIRSMERRLYRNMLWTLLILFSVIPSVNIFGDTFGAAGGYSLLWFATLYFIAGYLRKWPMEARPFGMYYVTACLVLCGVRAAGKAIGGVMGTLAGLQLQYNGPLVVLAAVSLFLAAVNGPVSYGRTADRFIGRIASLSLGVYLLHDHGLISGVLWNDWIRLDDVADHPGAFLLRSLLALMLIFTCGLAVEWGRQNVMYSIITAAKRLSISKSRR